MEITKKRLNFDKCMERYFLTEADLPEEDAMNEDEPKETESDDEDGKADEIETKVAEGITAIIKKNLKLKNVTVTAKYNDNPFKISVELATNKSTSIKIDYDRNFKIIKGISLTQNFFAYGDEDSTNLSKIIYFMLASNKLLKMIKRSMSSVINGSETENKVETNLDSAYEDEKIDAAKKQGKEEAEQEQPKEEAPAPKEAPKGGKIAPDEEIDPEKVGMPSTEEEPAEEETPAPEESPEETPAIPEPKKNNKPKPAPVEK